MKKGTMMVFSALLMSCFLAVPAEAKGTAGLYVHARQ